MIDEALSRIHHAFRSWSQVPVRVRCDHLSRIRSVIVDRQEEIARTITRETGKPITEVLNQEIAAVLGMLAFCEKAFPRWLQENSFRYWRPGFWTKQNTVFLEPLGPIAVIGPSTFPFSLPVMQACVVLLCGNCVIVKPSELCPDTAGLIRSVFGQSELPENVVKVVEGAAEAVEQIIAHEAIKKVVFTGSYRTGKRVAELCGRYFKPVILELGGNGAAIVCDDADLDLAVKGVTWSAFYANGSSCVGTKRVFVPASLAGEFAERLLEEIQSIRIGDPLIPSTEMGNTPNAQALNRIKELTGDAVARGARMWTKTGEVGEISSLDFPVPVVLFDATPSMSVMQEDVSSPLLAIREVDSVNQAIQEVNESRFGLSVSIWTKNPKKAREIARQLEVGMVWVNDSSVGLPQFPWGGTKQSGWGRLFSREVVSELTNVKVLSHDRRRSSSRKVWWFPYSKEKWDLFLLANRWLSGSDRFRSTLQSVKIIGGLWKTKGTYRRFSGKREP